MKVYILFVGFYDDRMIQGVFATKELAEQFMAQNLPSHDEWNGIEEHVVVEVLP